MGTNYYEEYHIKCDEGVYKRSLAMLNSNKYSMQENLMSACTMSESECKWIACDNIACCRKNLTCITRSKLPNTKVSSTLKTRLKFSELLSNPNNFNDNNKDSCNNSAIGNTHCMITRSNEAANSDDVIRCYDTKSYRDSTGLTSIMNANGMIRRRKNYSMYSSRSSWSFHCGWILVLMALLTFSSSAGARANELSANNIVPNRNQSDVCRDNYDIRNNAQDLLKLRGCRVIEGYLQFLLVEHNESVYEDLSFPELREINGYLMLYRVYGLKTLSKLFPNLAIIGGKVKFLNYALIIYEMIHLQEIGLTSLTDILDGAVRIEKNAQLCYTNTIDWTLIARNAKRDEHTILDNKNANACPNCPGDNSDTLRCPIASHEHQAMTKSKRLCWNQNHCQKVCPTRCKGACDDNNNCCDDQCIGGCFGNSTNCTACKSFSLVDTKEFHCVDKCPVNTLEFQERRCITEEECLQLPPPKGLMDQERKHYKSFNYSCILYCPNNYFETVQNNKLTCQLCSDDINVCHKECNGGVVNNIAAAQKLKYCTHIKNSLEIKIMGAMNIVKELEENLAMIQEINGYLKVVRSYPLVSLNFLKSLQSIRGETLENEKYSLIVMDNVNLQDLWDWDKHPPLKIHKGKMSFHFNPKLCLNKIDELARFSQVTNSPLEVDQNSNGDRVPCNVSSLEVRLEKKSNFAAIISWKQVEYEDDRSLLGYVVSRMKAPYQNVTVYDGRDACGGDGWIVEDVAKPGPTDIVMHIFTHLEPYTQYAYYVKTYTVASARMGAQSPVQYFTTLPDQPSFPQKMSVHSNSSSELVVKWEPPLEPNGNVTHYILEVTYQPDYNDRNYCRDILKPEELKPIIMNDDITTPSPVDHCNCANEFDNKPKVLGQAEADNIITFEDQLQNQVFIKIENGNERYKRMATSFDDVQRTKNRYSEAQNTLPILQESLVNSSSNSSVNSSVNFVIRTNGTTYVIKNLKHYALYSISLKACREEEKQEIDEFQLCSVTKMRTERTLKFEGADDIKIFKVEASHSNQSLGDVILSWEEPKQPNGLIYTYQIEYSRVDLVDAKPVPICVTHQDFLDKGRSYSLNNLSPGNYSIRVMAVSKAGNGKFTPMKYFLINETSSGPSPGTIVGYVFLVFLLLACATILLFCVYRKYFPPASSIKLITSVNPEYVSMQYQPDEWEVPREKIKLIRELGQGSFGMVYEGIASDLIRNNSEIKCAIKTVNEHATDRERIEFLNEASVMKAFDTAHVVRLLGVVSRGQPTLVVMELMANGDLKSYLRSHRPDTESYDPDVCTQPPTLKRILQMAIEIADGMAYLSAKKFVHRDLAARNCMVSDNLTVKIGDFGMTRDIYETDYYRKGTKGLLPVRWMAPESLKDGVFTSSSDVWSYGVVLWEMATLASQPYQGLSNDQVLRYVIDGGVMERPENCPDELYDLMRLTWQHKPSARPSFFELETMLNADSNPEFRKVSFYHSPQGQEALVTMQNTISANDDPTTPLRHTNDDEYQSDFDVENPTQQIPNDHPEQPFTFTRIMRGPISSFDLDQKIGSYQDSMSYIGSTPGTSYGHRDKDFSEDAVSVFGSRSPAFYSITNKSNTTSPDRIKNVVSPTYRDMVNDIVTPTYRDVISDTVEAETQFSSTAPILPNANGCIVGVIGPNNGSANIKTAEC